ncbi:MAG: HIT family protein [Nanoarchaeota archaeon]|nr:HIT family protein [Nanoarchaeota archaeon]
MVEISPQDQEALKEKLKDMSPEELKEFQKKNCIFCQIISGKVPSQQIYQDDKSLAVLDINPANKGHILLLPKEHHSIMPQMSEEEIAHLFIVAKYLSQAQLKAFKAQGSTIFVANGLAAGQRAQHFMLHIIPRFENDNLSVLNIPQKQIPESDLEKLREALIKKINEVFKLKKETFIEKKTAPVIEAPPEPVEEKEPEPKEEKPKEKPKKKKTTKKPKPKKTEKEEASLDDVAELFK